MRTVYKYPAHAGLFDLTLPKGAELLCVAIQHGVPQMWALVDDEAPTEKRSFCGIGTGVEIPKQWKVLSYIGTFQLNNGYLVFHVFELTKGD